MTSPSQRSWLHNLPVVVFIVLCAIVALMAVLAIGHTFLSYSSPFAGRSRVVVEDRTEWPKPLRELLDEAVSAQIDAEPVKVFRLVDFTEEFFYWQMKSSPELIALMINDWKLKPGTKREIEAFWSQWPPELEKRSYESRQKFLGNYQRESDNFIVVVDEASSVIYGYYYFNF